MAFGADVKIRLALVNLVENPYEPHLGLAYIATFISKKAHDIDVRIIDINFEEPMDEIAKYKPHIVGLSSMTIKYRQTCRFAQEVKKRLKIPVIIGGIHITTCPEDFSDFFDIGVLGEGEQTALDLIDLFKKDGSFNEDRLKKIDGIMYRTSAGQIRKTAPRHQLQNIDDIPYPDVSFLNNAYFKKENILGGLYSGNKDRAFIITARGCPYECSFCSPKNLWRGIRFHSPKYLAAHVKYLKKHRVDFITIWDDLFTVSKSRLSGILNEFSNAGALGDMRFACQGRAELIDDELCCILKKIGVATINFGFESGSDRILRYLKKGKASVELNKRAVRICKNHGFSVTFSLMLGSPGETVEDMKKTLEFIDFLKQNGVNDGWLFVTTPLPGTELWEYAKSKNKNIISDKVDFNNIFDPLCLDESVSKKDFLSLYREAKGKLSGLPGTKKRSKYFHLKNWVYHHKHLNGITRKAIGILPRRYRLAVKKSMGVYF